MCFHKAPPGTSAWESFNLIKLDDAFTIVKFRTEDDAPFYGTKAEYKDMKLDDLRELLKATPFEPNVEKTEYYKSGMIKSIGIGCPLRGNPPTPPDLRIAYPAVRLFQGSSYPRSAKPSFCVK